ncbi:hypothetical protein HQ489_01190 [Candidatus Woesearchaeota archaeon]|nr:hypothetical protein [Candidatus Woesearchaeota archaeon]
MAIQTFTSKITKKVFLNDDVFVMTLSCPKEFTFKAGQFVTIRVKNGEESKMRSYSILNPPSEKGKVDLCIKIIEGGFASECFKTIKEDDEYEMKGPFGHFMFDETSENKEHWLISNGTGVVPMYSMLKEFLPQNSDIKFTMLFGSKVKKDLIFHEEFLELAEKYPQFTYTPSITREEWDGKKGRVQAHLPEDVKNKTFYICGLKELVVETKDILIEKGVDAKNIKFERYS